MFLNIMIFLFEKHVEKDCNTGDNHKMAENNIENANSLLPSRGHMDAYCQCFAAWSIQTFN